MGIGRAQLVYFADKDGIAQLVLCVGKKTSGSAAWGRCQQYSFGGISVFLTCLRQPAECAEKSKKISGRSAKGFGHKQEVFKESKYLKLFEFKQYYVLCITTKKTLGVSVGGEPLT